MEIDEQAQAAPRGYEVGLGLRGVSGVKLIDCFEFYDQLLIDQQVDLALTDEPLAVKDVEFGLPFEADFSIGQLDAERFLVDRLGETWSKSSVDFDCRPDHCAGKPVKPSPGLFLASWRLGVLA